MKGSTFSAEQGTYGTRGVPSASNTPGARVGASSWSDAHGDLWLFGGSGVDGAGIQGPLNDLWKFDGVNWTWVSGPDTNSQSAGTYGTEGVPDPANLPPSRVGASSWIDAGGNLWLFGGGPGTPSFNDLWRFDGANWTWMGGAPTLSQRGTYGTLGVADPANVPGGRYLATAAVDGSGQVWLFGGFGADSTGTNGYLNDLWRFDGTNWTWMAGTKFEHQAGVYGTKGIASSSNGPGARELAVSWTDSLGSFWLFGGTWNNTAGNPEAFNDLWKFDGAEWTWVSGSNTPNQIGSYGLQGVAASTNVPGARFGSVSWTDGSGRFWLFGGNGVGSPSGGYMSDLWMFDGTQWTWISGSNLANSAGIYGIQGTPAAGNYPAGRSLAVGWRDPAGSLWLFGGTGWGIALANDLWRWSP